MSNSVQRSMPHVRLSLTALLGLLIGLTIAGCGGGGGGGNSGTGGGNGGGPGQVGSGAVITGIVTDNTGSATPLQNATISVVGTTLVSTPTDANGKFTIYGVPATATQFRVNNPNPKVYFNYVDYNGLRYDTTQCPLPLPTLASGATIALPFTIRFYPGGQTPPPPPSTSGGACPQ